MRRRSQAVEVGGEGWGREYESHRSHRIAPAPLSDPALFSLQSPSVLRSPFGCSVRSPSAHLFCSPSSLLPPPYLLAQVHQNCISKLFLACLDILPQELLKKCIPYAKMNVFPSVIGVNVTSSAIGVNVTSRLGKSCQPYYSVTGSQQRILLYPLGTLICSVSSSPHFWDSPKQAAQASELSPSDIPLNMYLWSGVGIQRLQKEGQVGRRTSLINISELLGKPYLSCESPKFHDKY
ncbi:hypothetical protein RIF29_03324 [Crotalaria pallida]|uniref:Uncharacterized protein n=1 Tax=Crotalaria pallida TaxID=3830 RepID=A0AAN9P9R9_CROPI